MSITEVKALGLRTVINSLIAGAIETAFILATIINQEIAELNTSFLNWQAADTWLNNTFSHYNFSKSPNSYLGLDNFDFYLRF